MLIRVGNIAFNDMYKPQFISLYYVKTPKNVSMFHFYV